jgi:hypothetical protein
MFSVADEFVLLGRRVTQDPPAMTHRRDDDLMDLEFSDYGRSARFVAGWWIVPGLFLGTALLGFYIAG